MVMLIQCTMTAEETTKDYVTRLWAHVARLRDLSEVWHERLILIMLRLGHSKPDVRDLLTKDKPRTIADAERICKEYESRQREKPVSSRFVAAMAPADPQLGRPWTIWQSAVAIRGPKLVDEADTTEAAANSARAPAGTNSDRRPLSLAFAVASRDTSLKSAERQPAPSSRPTEQHGVGVTSLTLELAIPDPWPTSARPPRGPRDDSPQLGGIRRTYRSLTTPRRRRNQHTVNTTRRRSW